MLGVYLHGLAGDLAAAELGEESLTASDLINYLPKAFQKLKTEE
jgi:NAD(P)H-hydrate epimerase